MLSDVAAAVRQGGRRSLKQEKGKPSSHPTKVGPGKMARKGYSHEETSDGEYVRGCVGEEGRLGMIEIERQRHQNDQDKRYHVTTH